MWQPVVATSGGRTDTFGPVRTVDVTRPVTAAVVLSDSPDPLVLVGHRSDTTALRATATYVAANQPDRLVAHAVTDHAPLAAVAALDAVVGLARDAGHGLAAWQDLLDAVWSGAVLRTVTGLTSPDPPMVQHLRSWLPRSRFLVRQGPDAASVPASQAGTLLSEVTRRSVSMLTTLADDDTVRAVAQLVAPTTLRTVDATGTWRGVYGSDEVCQLVLLPERPGDHVRPPGPRCAGCGQHASGLVCLFCRTRTGLPDHRTSRLLERTA